MIPSLPRMEELAAPGQWRQVDFISDLHLQASEPHTVQAWTHYMAHTCADAVFILGDLFEVWVGDDVLDDPAGFESQCAQVLLAASQRHPLFFLHGNRDFLLGARAAQACGMTLLSDPTALTFGERRWLLSHGDALCLDDTAYQEFRDQVRRPDWQQAFLARPLKERRDLAQHLRTESETRKRSTASSYADVDAAEAERWLQAAQARELIHGHTHKPADHLLPSGLQRHVLSDWDGNPGTAARLEVLRLSLDSHGLPHPIQRLSASDAC